LKRLVIRNVSLTSEQKGGWPKSTPCSVLAPIADDNEQLPLGDEMSLGLILVIILIILLLGGFSGRFGGYGYGYGHRGIGIVGIILIVLLVLLLMHRI
jgi:hypothetical protein